MKKTVSFLCFVVFTSHLYAQDTEYSGDTVTFEVPYAYLINSDSDNNIWETGTPVKEIFDAPFRGSNVIVTKVQDFYPLNNHSYFDLLVSYNNCPQFPVSFFIEFHHKFDTDSGRDGGYIEISRDGGQTWLNVLADYYGCTTPSDGFRTENLYAVTDTLYNGQPGFSGKSDGWVKTIFGWEYCLVKDLNEYNDTAIIRFNFISDDIGEDMEGWMIDDIRLFSYSIRGAVNDYQDSRFVIYPNPASDYIYISSLPDAEINEVQLVDMNGRFIKRTEFSSEFLLDGINPGFYFLKISTRKFSVYKKLLVK